MTTRFPVVDEPAATAEHGAIPGDTPWVDRYAQRALGMTSSAIRELLN